ncbi:unnamed protein product, partial [marine sediment metagenome]
MGLISKEEPFWERRYLKGGTSGLGSVGKTRAWKWSVIDEFIPKIDDVVDVGCGDLSFWGNKTCKQYIGIDISKTVVEDNRLKRPKWTFIHSNAGKYLQDVNGRVVLCLDLLFHIMKEENFVKILNNLCRYSEKWIFVHTWSSNPFMQKGSPHYTGKHKVTDSRFQYFRPLRSWLSIFKKYGFKLVATRRRESKDRCTKLGEMFIF